MPSNKEYMFDELVIGSKNPAKVERFQYLVKNIAKKIYGIINFNIDTKPEEIGTTSEENAEIKAKYYSKLTNLPVFTEDESLFVDFLPKDKQPGVNVRRINGKEEATDEELFTYWEGILKDIPKEKRKGYWHISYCLGLPDSNVFTVSKDHPILFFYPSSKVKIPGWPMSSLEGSENFNKPHSEFTEEEKRIHEEETNIEILNFFKSIPRI